MPILARYGARFVPWTSAGRGRAPGPLRPTRWRRKSRRTPERFGKGALEGVAGRSANNAGAQTSFIPMLTLGIPSNAIMAPDDRRDDHPGHSPRAPGDDRAADLFWGLSPHVDRQLVSPGPQPAADRPLVLLLRVPYACSSRRSSSSAASASTRQLSSFDILSDRALGLLGFVFFKLGYEPAPLALGFILGPLLEENFRRALQLSRGDPMVFVERPVSAGLLVFAALMLAAMLLPSVKRTREVALREDTAPATPQ